MTTRPDATQTDLSIDQAHDLQVTRLIAAPVATVWACLSQTELLRQWWVPAPVRVADMVMQPQPGGRFFTHMVLPDGAEPRVEMMILLAEPCRRLVFTDLMTQGFVPVARPMFGFAAELVLQAEGLGTRYTATARHARPDDAIRHRDMGFHEGWGAVADQLAQLAPQIPDQKAPS